MRALRALLVLAVVVGLLVGAVLLADRVVGSGIEAAATEVVEARLAEASDPGAPFTDVSVDLEGSALRGLVAGRFEAVTVVAAGGVVEGVPVRGLRGRATDVVPDGSSVGSLDLVLVADAAAAVASRLDPAAAEAVRRTAVAVPPDRLAAQVPVALPDGTTLPADVEVLARVADGTLVVEPVRAQVDVLSTLALDGLPAGLLATGVEVRDEAGTPVVEVALACATGCRLR